MLGAWRKHQKHLCIFGLNQFKTLKIFGLGFDKFFLTQNIEGRNTEQSTDSVLNSPIR